MLIARGLSRSATLVVILVLATACASVGIASAVLRLPDGAMLIAWCAAGAAYYQLLRRPAVLLDALVLLGAVVDSSKVQSAPR